MSVRPVEEGNTTFRGSLQAGRSPALCLSLSSRLSRAPLPQDLLLGLAADALADGRIRTFLLSGPEGGGGLEPVLALAAGIIGHGGEPVVTLSCAGRSREELLSDMAKLGAAGITNVLFVTGDMPAGAHPSRYRSLFDVDSVRLLMLMRDREQSPPHGALFAGCAVAPFKTLEAEVVWQYKKLRRKAAVGAEFTVSQPGFDMGRIDELLRYCRQERLALPLVAGLLVPDAEMAERIEAGKVPGLALPESVATACRQEAKEADGGRAKRLRRAASSLAILRGLGCAGVLLEGPFAHYRDIRFILDRHEEMLPAWKEELPRGHFPMEGFHYLERTTSGLSRSARAPVSPLRKKHPLYIFGHLVDLFAFKRTSVITKTLDALCHFCDRGPFRRRVIWIVEFLAKAPLYGCRMCGDCALYACGFICYVDRCPKKLVNGPCGGSRDGWCEVYPGRRRCLWVDVYDRLKALIERPSFTAPPIPAGNRRLEGTCSWINFFLGRDHQKRGSPFGNKG